MYIANSNSQANGLGPNCLPPVTGQDIFQQTGSPSWGQVGNISTPQLSDQMFPALTTGPQEIAHSQILNQVFGLISEVISLVRQVFSSLFGSSNGFGQPVLKGSANDPMAAVGIAQPMQEQPIISSGFTRGVGKINGVLDSIMSVAPKIPQAVGAMADIFSNSYRAITDSFGTKNGDA